MVLVLVPGVTADSIDRQLQSSLAIGGTARIPILETTKAHKTQNPRWQPSLYILCLQLVPYSGPTQHPSATPEEDGGRSAHDGLTPAACPLLPETGASRNLPPFASTRSARLVWVSENRTHNE